MTIDSVSITTLNALYIDYGNSSPIVIDFWATWCLPCIMEFANIMGTAMLLGERKINALFISIDNQN
jgi:thiol-disulfide isomerase/thioredoxin